MLLCVSHHPHIAASFNKESASSTPPLDIFFAILHHPICAEAALMVRSLCLPPCYNADVYCLALISYWLTDLYGKKEGGGGWKAHIAAYNTDEAIPTHI